VADIQSTVNKQVLVWAINKQGFVDPFTQEPLDVRNAVTFEIRPKGTEESFKLYVVTGENYDKILPLLEAKYDMQDIIDGRTL
jgi:hypothetical protein